MTAELPDDITQLKQMLMQLQQQHQAQAEEISELKAQLEHALAQLKLSRAKQFGRQSEKTPRGTFNEAEQQSRLAPRRKTARKQAASRCRPGWNARSGCIASTSPIAAAAGRPCSAVAVRTANS